MLEYVLCEICKFKERLEQVYSFGILDFLFGIYQMVILLSFQLDGKKELFLLEMKGI